MIEPNWAQKSLKKTKFYAPFLPEDKQKINILAEKLQPLGYLNISKSMLYLLSFFREKYYYFLHYLGYFGRKQGEVTSQRIRNNMWLIQVNSL